MSSNQQEAFNTLFTYNKIFSYSSPIQFFQKKIQSALGLNENQNDEKMKIIFESNPNELNPKPEWSKNIDLKNVHLFNTLGIFYGSLKYIAGYWLLTHIVTFGMTNIKEFDQKRVIANSLFRRTIIPVWIASYAYTYYSRKSDYTKCIEELKKSVEKIDDNILFNTLANEKYNLKIARDKYNFKASEILKTSRVINYERNRDSPLGKYSKSIQGDKEIVQEELEESTEYMRDIFVEIDEDMLDIGSNEISFVRK